MTTAEQRPASRLPRWVLLGGTALVLGPSAVLLTVLALSALVSDLDGGAVVQVLGIAAFLVLAIGLWYLVGRAAGAVALRAGVSPYAALALVAPGVALLGAAAWSVADDGRALLGVLVFLANAVVLMVRGMRAAVLAAG